MSNYEQSLIEKLEALRMTPNNLGYAGQLTEFHYGINNGLDKAIALIEKYSSACPDMLAGASDSSGGDAYPNGHPCFGEFESPAAANASEISALSKLNGHYFQASDKYGDEYEVIEREQVERILRETEPVSSGDDNYAAAMYEISEIVRVARDNPKGLREFLMLNFPDMWGISKEEHRAILDGDRQESEQPVDCRAMFEKYATEECMDIERIPSIPSSSGGTNYANYDTQAHYETWKAASLQKRESGDDLLVKDLSMLCKRLAFRLGLGGERRQGDKDACAKAMDFLKRKGLLGSPLRNVIEGEQP